MQKSAREHFSKAKNKHFELMSEINKKKNRHEILTNQHKNT